ncbi:MAG TPA: ABC transporter permease [Kiritimatiellia bacterium]|jgi:putative ABC transport system permease protein|nr:MAG: Macrolide export ATP-binding/permease protein MacB [Verrucomicrobia bacterium ADurb.Bin070]HPO36757.1 ABC transporter permease [Kiritimatiellia bacterium]HQQ91128.1 ABC transporter permease [Kiritimatiellia bacterium]
MNFFMILKVALRAIFRNKTRSLLTALGIIVGIAAVIAVVAIGQGAQAMMIKEISSIGNNIIMVFPGSRTQGGVHGGSGSSQTLTAEDGENIAQDLAHLVRAVTPVVRTGSQVIYQENNWSTQIQGVSVDYPEVRNWTAEDGVFFTEADQRAGARVCVLGATVVDNLFTSASPVGQTIRIRNMPFRVLGVMARKGSNTMGHDQDDVILVPFTTVKRVLQNSIFNNVNMLMISLHSLDDITAAKEEIGALLRQRHKLAPQAPDDFNSIDMTEITNTIGSMTKLMTLLLTVVASISLLVGGIGIMNIMLVSVTERTREIGLRMAIGATPSDILLQFIAEAMALSIVGGLLGVLLGTGGARLVGRLQQWPILITESSVMVAFLFSAAVGMFFGFYPALRASRLNPIDCLRYE